MTWADGVIFGTPTRYGNPSAQLKQFIDTLGPQWQAAELAVKAYAGFTSSATAHAWPVAPTTTRSATPRRTRSTTSPSAS